MNENNKEIAELKDIVNKRLVSVIEALPYPKSDPNLLQMVGDLKFLAIIRKYLDKVEL